MIFTPSISLFQSTHSVGSGTSLWICSTGRAWDFNPPTPWGVGRLASYQLQLYIVDFNPPTPWGVGHFGRARADSHADFNPPTPWGVGPVDMVVSPCTVLFQSTHSVGSGTVFFRLLDLLSNYFNPPTPWGVGLNHRTDNAPGLHFNPPTPWGVGQSKNGSPHPLTSISIHPLRGEWDCPISNRVPDNRISIHPLRGEWDGTTKRSIIPAHLFQSTHSVGSGTVEPIKIDRRIAFQSTHSVGSGTRDFV